MNDQQPDPSIGPAEQTDGPDPAAGNAAANPVHVPPGANPNDAPIPVGVDSSEAGRPAERHGSPLEALKVLNPATMSRGTKARLAAHLIDELKRITYEDPAFDVARQYLDEARQVLPIKAD